MIACVEQLPVEIRSNEQNLVVEGLVVNEPGSSFVRLSFTSSFSGIVDPEDDTVSAILSGADVRVVENNSDTIIFFEVNNGFYRAEDSLFSGDINSTYQLLATLSSGRRIESSIEIMYRAPVIDSLFFEFETSFIPGTEQRMGNHRFLITVESNNSNASPFFRTVSNGIAQVGALVDLRPPPDPPWCLPGEAPCAQTCWSFREPINRSVFLGNTTSFERSFTLEIANEEYDFHSFYFIEVTLYSLSEGGYDFWQSIADQLEIEGTIFDPQLGEVLDGNIIDLGSGESVIGYFGASALNKNSLFFNRFESAQFLLPLPTAPVGPDCTNEWESATLIRPEPFF